MTFRHARLAAFVLTATAAVASWTIPIYTGQRWTTFADGTPRHETFRLRLTDAPVAAAAPAVTLLPVVVAVLPLLVHRVKLTAAAILLVFSLVGAMTIGLFYLPGAVLMFLPEPVLERPQ